MAKQKSKGGFSKSRLIFYFFAVLIFLFAVIYFSTIKKDVKLLGKVNVYWLAASIVGQLATYFGSAIIYRQLLRLFVRSKLTVAQFFQASIVALFFNQTVPSAGISGNAFFFNFLRKRNIPANHIISLIAVELLSFYAAIEFIIFFLVSGSFFLYKMPAFFRWIFAGGALIFVIFGFFIGFAGKRKSVTALYKKITKIRWIQKLLARLDKPLERRNVPTPEHDPWHIFLEHKLALAKAIVFQIVIFVADAFTIFALFHGLGIPLTFVVACITLLLTKIVSVLPVSPGGLILYESSLTFFLVKMTAPFGTSIIVTLLYRVLSFWLPMPVGFFLYKKLE